METTLLRAPVFYGEYDRDIDPKNRIFVPAEIRNAFDPERDGQGFFMTIGINGVPWFHGAKFYEQWALRLPPALTPTEEQLEYDQANFALACPIPWDKQGRIVIPDRTLKRTRTEKLVTLVGVRDHLELWNRAAWAAQRDRLEQRRPVIAIRAQQITQAAATTSNP